ncbi:ammonium transporter [Cyanobacterium stanieri LEGE 03274]|uniref:Ammonium transporter n=1 Tax=Cyanobacterium stanieri LEGE 03274 TaxID=1828756 RepID=A0ABR9V415_9CHRO|nr:ammonium transporter [Cyanobacterium stanieri]MBE9222294.1 ammonium transporter [Cyanobacterium stanieri LEGE 03274]
MVKLKTTKKRIKRIAQQINFSPSWQGCIILSVFLLLSCVSSVGAQDTLAELTDASKELKVGLDTFWVVFASILVIFMNAGFAMLETGLCRRKNAVNMLSKNLIVFAISTVAYWAVGFALMFGDGTNFFGFSGFFLAGMDNSPAINGEYIGVYSSLGSINIPLAAKFLFQVAFAGTAATIVSGAVAERIKFIDFILFSVFLVAIAYPLVGHWVWGNGWLAQLGFKDFAGSTVVHSVGGWSALVGSILLGARNGKYKPSGGIMPLPGHNLSLATLGCFILWIGWFGFNAGSTFELSQNISYIALTTNLAAASGAISATIISWVLAGKPDLSLIINGVLSGLVAITASCAFVSYGDAMIIGIVGGALVVVSVYYLDNVKIDDPVGAISVHLVNGIWGTIAVGLFASPIVSGDPEIRGLFTTGNISLLGTQLLGIFVVGVFMVVYSFIVWSILKALLGLRVSEEEEYFGLDIGEHGMEAYNGFSEDVNEI